MNYKDIELANKSIKTTDIKGKEYAEVNQRIKAFRMVYPMGTIETEIVSLENGVVIIKATCKDDERVLGVGHAYEKENSTFINKTSYIENCETSAVGRALGMCGFGIDTSVASFEEVQTAIANQPSYATNTEKKTFQELCKSLRVEPTDILKKVGWHTGEKLTNEQHGKALILLKEIENEQGK